jgi:hypothetical protein
MCDEVNIRQNDLREHSSEYVAIGINGFIDINSFNI